MFSLLVTLASLAIATLTVASPVEKRATTICGQWDSLVEGQYTIYQDLWGEASATSGGQCSTVNSLSGTTIAWSTNWTWAGANSQVKSYAQVQWDPATALSQIKTLPTTWKWSYTGSGMVADVSYDAFTAATESASAQYEIMVWLAAIGGAGPISATGSPVATPSLGGVTWNLFSGMNGATTVFSFVAQTEQTNFSGDLMNFFNYLIANQGLSSSQILQSVASGTEPFIGSNAVLTTSAYSITMTTGTNTGGGTTSVSKSASTSVAAPTSTGSGGTQSVYGQCGGSGWTGPTTCASGSTCVVSNPFYSQCIPS